MYCDTSTVNCTLHSHASLSLFHEARRGDVTPRDLASSEHGSRLFFKSAATSQVFRFSLLAGSEASPYRRDSWC